MDLNMQEKVLPAMKEVDFATLELRLAQQPAQEWYESLDSGRGIVPFQESLSHEVDNEKVIQELTDAQAAAMGLGPDTIAIDEFRTLLGEDLYAMVVRRESLLQRHVQMIAARVALEQGLDPIAALDELDRTLARMGTDQAFANQVKDLGSKMGAPKVGHTTPFQDTRPNNRHARRAAAAQARRK